MPTGKPNSAFSKIKRGAAAAGRQNGEQRREFGEIADGAILGRYD